MEEARHNIKAGLRPRAGRTWEVRYELKLLESREAPQANRLEVQQSTVASQIVIPQPEKQRALEGTKENWCEPMAVLRSTRPP